MPRKIFISYRHSDSTDSTGRLDDDLRAYYGDGYVYRDVRSNRAAVDFVAQMEQELDTAAVVLAVIGPDWLTSTDHTGRRRLDDPDDYVRRELERALDGNVQIIPVLVDGAAMPAERELPPSLRAVARRHAAKPLSDAHWAYEFGLLVAVLEGFGLRPSSGAGGGKPALGARVKEAATRVEHYERTIRASRGRLYDAITDVVAHLRYREVAADPRAARVTFKVPGVVMAGRTIVARAVDSTAGDSTIVVEFPSLSLGGAAGAAGALAVMFTAAVAAGALAGAVALERRFALGFIDNVQGILDGSGLGGDSSRFPGMEKLQNRIHEV